ATGAPFSKVCTAPRLEGKSEISVRKSICITFAQLTRLPKVERINVSVARSPLAPGRAEPSAEAFCARPPANLLIFCRYVHECEASHRQIRGRLRRTKSGAVR